MFYQDSPAPPFGYLWCDGSQITTNTSTTGGDEKYRNLIEVLKGVNKNSTTGTQSAYLPDFSGCYALGSTSTYENYNTSTTNNRAGTIDLNIDYFPSHNHSIDTVNYTNTTNNYSFNYNYTQTMVVGIDNFIPTNNAGKSNQENRDSNKLRGNHAHNLSTDDDIVSNSGYLLANYNKNIINQLSENDINISSTGSNNNILVQPKSYQLKAAICYL